MSKFLCVLVLLFVVQDAGCITAALTHSRALNNPGELQPNTLKRRQATTKNGGDNKVEQRVEAELLGTSDKQNKKKRGKPTDNKKDSVMGALNALAVTDQSVEQVGVCKFKGTNTVFGVHGGKGVMDPGLLQHYQSTADYGQVLMVFGPKMKDHVYNFDGVANHDVWNSNEWLAYECGSIPSFADKTKRVPVIVDCLLPTDTNGYCQLRDASLKYFRISFVYYLNKGGLGIRNNWFSGLDGTEEANAKTMQIQTEERCAIGFSPNTLMADLKSINHWMQTEQFCVASSLMTYIVDKQANLRDSCMLRDDFKKVADNLKTISNFDIVLKVLSGVAQVVAQAPMASSAVDAAASLISVVDQITQLIIQKLTRHSDQLIGMAANMLSLRLTGVLVKLKARARLLCDEVAFDKSPALTEFQRMLNMKRQNIAQTANNFPKIGKAGMELLKGFEKAIGSSSKALDEVHTKSSLRHLSEQHF